MTGSLCINITIFILATIKNIIQCTMPGIILAGFHFECDIFLSNMTFCIFPNQKYTYLCNYPKKISYKSAFLQKVVQFL